MSGSMAGNFLVGGCSPDFWEEFLTFGKTLPRFAEAPSSVSAAFEHTWPAQPKRLWDQVQEASPRSKEGLESGAMDLPRRKSSALNGNSAPSRGALFCVFTWNPKSAVLEVLEKIESH